MNTDLSSDFEFKEFIRRVTKHPERVFRDRRYTPVELIRNEEYDAETDRLLAEIRGTA